MLIVLVVFGAMDKPHACYMLVNFLEIQDSTVLRVLNTFLLK